MELTGGILLTGGASSRMGRDKASLLLDGVTLARRNGALLASAVDRAVEVGPRRSGLEAVEEDPPLSGPLAAILAGRRALIDRGLGAGAAILVVAVDLPFLSAELLTAIANWPGAASVLPVVDGQAQPLLARWSARDLDDAENLFVVGERSLRRVPDRSRALLLPPEQLPGGAEAFADFDRPEDVAALGLEGRLRAAERNGPAQAV